MEIEIEDEERFRQTWERNIRELRIVHFSVIFYTF